MGWQRSGDTAADDPRLLSVLAGLPAGAQVRDRDGRVWTQMTVAWQADDSLEQMDDQDLMLLRGPLVLVHDPGAQQ